MDLRKLAVKVFASDPGGVKPEELIPVFHRWIQERRVEGILVDVADYSHLPAGPGVVLIGHDGDYAVDSDEGPLGLLYTRKTPLEGSAPERIVAAVRAALDACDKLESDLAGKLMFRTDEFLVLVNDRLIAPNSDETFQSVKADVETAVAKVHPGAKAEFSRANGDGRERFGVRVRVSTNARVAAVKGRL